MGGIGTGQIHDGWMGEDVDRKDYRIIPTTIINHHDAPPTHLTTTPTLPYPTLPTLPYLYEVPLGVQHLLSEEVIVLLLLLQSTDGLQILYRDIVDEEEDEDDDDDDDDASIHSH